MVSISAYASLIDATDNGMQQGGLPPLVRKLFMPFFKLACYKEFDVRISEASPEHDIAKIAPRPVLLMHGTADDQIYVENAHKLYEASGEQAQLVVVEDAGHIIFTGDGTGEENREYQRTIVSFLDNAVNK